MSRSEEDAPVRPSAEEAVPPPVQMPQPAQQPQQRSSGIRLPIRSAARFGPADDAA